MDEALKDQTGNLLGDVDIRVHEEAVEVLREVMPPAYLQEQTEENIDRFTEFPPLRAGRVGDLRQPEGAAGAN